MVKHIIIIFSHCGIFNRILKIEFLRNKGPPLLLYYPFSIRTLTTVAHLYCVRSVHSAFCFHPLCCRIVYCVCIPTVTRIVSNRIRAAPSHSPSALQQEPEVEVKGQSSIALCEHAAVCGVHVTPRTNGNELVLQCTVSHPANPIWLLALLCSSHFRLSTVRKRWMPQTVGRTSSFVLRPLSFVRLAPSWDYVAY